MEKEEKKKSSLRVVFDLRKLAHGHEKTAFHQTSSSYGPPYPWSSRGPTYPCGRWSSVYRFTKYGQDVRNVKEKLNEMLYLCFSYITTYVCYFERNSTDWLDIATLP